MAFAGAQNAVADCCEAIVVRLVPPRLFCACEAAEDGPRRVIVRRRGGAGRSAGREHGQVVVGCEEPRLGTLNECGGEAFGVDECRADDVVDGVLAFSHSVAAVSDEGVDVDHAPIEQPQVRLRSRG